MARVSPCRDFLDPAVGVFSTARWHRLVGRPRFTFDGLSALARDATYALKSQSASMPLRRFKSHPGGPLPSGPKWQRSMEGRQLQLENELKADSKVTVCPPLIPQLTHEEIRSTHQGHLVVAAVSGYQPQQSTHESRLFHRALPDLIISLIIRFL